MSIINHLARYLINFERLRKPVSFLVVFALCFGVLISVPLGFRSIPYEGIEFLGMALLACAAMGRIWCTIHIAGRKDKELCQTGPYSLCRNPLYLFSFIGMVGFFLAAQSLILATVGAILFLVYYRGVIRSEERRLRELFGERFDAYVESTPRFWPRSWQVESAERITINSKIIERGLFDILWFLLAIVLADIIELLHRNEFFHYITMPF